MVTDAQISFFKKLLEEKDFGRHDQKKLLADFCELNKKSASEWIEKALSLPKRDESNDPVVPAPF